MKTCRRIGVKHVATCREEDEGKSAGSGSTDSQDLEEEAGEEGGLIKSETVMLNVKMEAAADNQDSGDTGTENIQFQITLQEEEEHDEDKDVNTGVWSSDHTQWSNNIL